MKIEITVLKEGQLEAAFAKLRDRDGKELALMVLYGNRFQRQITVDTLQYALDTHNATLNEPKVYTDPVDTPVK